MRVRYSRDGGATWTVAYDYTSSVSGAQIRFNRDLNYIPFRCIESSTEIYRYISTEPGLVGHGVAQGFSTNNGTSSTTTLFVARWESIRRSISRPTAG